MENVAPTTAQLLARAEKAEGQLEMAIRQIEHSVADLEAAETLLRLICIDCQNNADEDKLLLVRDFVKYTRDNLVTWDIPF